VSFLSGLAVAQISEFSLILIALGYTLGHVGRETVGLVTLVGMVTIGVSTYLIIYSHQIYDRLAPALGIFERSRPLADLAQPHLPVDVIVYGYGRFGRQMVRRLAAAGHEVLVVDWDPHAHPDPEVADRVRVVFGDADDAEFPASLPLSSARWVVCTIPRVDTSRVLAGGLARWSFQGRIAVTAHTEADAERLADDVDAGRVHLVLNPFDDAAQKTAVTLMGQ
jgi:hypothetical protein